MKKTPKGVSPRKALAQGFTIAEYKKANQPKPIKSPKKK